MLSEPKLERYRPAGRLGSTARCNELRDRGEFNSFPAHRKSIEAPTRSRRWRAGVPIVPAQAVR